MAEVDRDVQGKTNAEIHEVWKEILREETDIQINHHISWEEATRLALSGLSAQEIHDYLHNGKKETIH